MGSSRLARINHATQIVAVFVIATDRQFKKCAVPHARGLNCVSRFSGDVHPLSPFRQSHEPNHDAKPSLVWSFKEHIILKAPCCNTEWSTRQCTCTGTKAFVREHSESTRVSP